jgi:hypothetical protein
MNSSSKWLLVFAGIIGALALTAVVLVLFTQGKNVTLLAADTPQGTVQRYLLALEDNDYQLAYTYLSPDMMTGMPPYNDWLSQNLNRPAGQTGWRATLGKTVQNGSYATVEVMIETSYPGGLMSSSQSNLPVTFDLTETGNSWLITSPTYIYWIY